MFCGWNTRLAPARKPRTNTPLTSVITSTTTMAVPMKKRHLVGQSPTADEEAGHRLDDLQQHPRHRHADRTDRHGDDEGAKITHRAGGPCIPISADTWRCHPAAGGITISTQAATEIATVAAFSA